ncbi:rRNA maturation RNase YbeY [Pararhizobium mangrovi]|uniref:Endoribonuclease YbeY n=1 Tax=Pararhizobium mangrovi TaxID=2590452 RepID=A0A506U4X3_9HYPH|nr:rRNA maturation RNase YbeY [Pararhizobium mangrovi]
MAIDIAREADGWADENELEAFAGHVVAVTARHLATCERQPFPNPAPELSILFADDARVRSLNAEWRGKDTATNVLSFPAFEIAPGTMPGPMLGDLVLARETIEREAEEMARPLKAHISHLLVHGFLHLLGYDHVDEREAEEMEALETRILAALDLPDPYRDSDPA